MENYKERFYEAVSLRDSGNLHDAKELLVELTNLYPEMTGAFLILGSIYFDMGLFALAGDNYCKVLSQKPGSEMASIGFFLSMLKQKKYDAAFSELKRYICLYTPKSYKEVIFDLITEKTVLENQIISGDLCK